MSDLVDKLREPDWHDPKCPFQKHCYCHEDGEPPLHDKVRHPHALEAADHIAALEAEILRLRDREARISVVHALCSDYFQQKDKCEPWRAGKVAGPPIVALYALKEAEAKLRDALAQQEGV